jgi:DNA-binding CsgD family transcriptional regulator
MQRNPVRWEDARDLLRITIEARAMGHGTKGCRAFIVDGLMRLVSADAGLFALDPSFGPAGTGPLAHVTARGREEGLRRMLDAIVLRRSSNPLLAVLARNLEPTFPSEGRTVNRHDAVSNTDWYASPFVKHCVAPAGYDDWLISARRTATRGVTSWIALLRARGERPFSHGERDLLQLFHEECGDALAPRDWTDDEEALSPRMQETLQWLLTGAPDKVIAQQLGISPHTAREYVKKLLQTFGASSRSQLIASFARKGAFRPAAASVIPLPSSRRLWAVPNASEH